MTKRFAVLLAAASVVCAAPALADEVVIHRSAPDVTVGSGPDTVVREHEVVREREPRDKVIIKKHVDEPAVVEKKTIIHHDD